MLSFFLLVYGYCSSKSCGYRLDYFAPMICQTWILYAGYQRIFDEDETIRPLSTQTSCKILYVNHQYAYTTCSALAYAAVVHMSTMTKADRIAVSLDVVESDDSIPWTEHRYL